MRMKKIILIICILLITALMAMPMLSCNNSNGNNNNANNTDNQNNESQDIDTGNGDMIDEPPKVDALSVLASLPDEDYGGYAFRILTSNWFNTTLEGRQAPDEEQTGDLINDALYIRDRLIEDKYNIQIAYNIIDYDSNKTLSTAQKAIKVGDDEFDFGMDNMIIFTKGLAQSGMLYDFNEVPNADISKEWWSKYAVRDLTIDGRFFFPTGDITARYPGSQYIMLFNKKLFADMGLPLPYQTVLDGEWTVDAFFAIIKDSSRDLDGNGVLGKNDFYGFALETMTSFCFTHAMGESLVKIVDGNPVFNVNTDKMVDVMGKLASVWGDPNYMYYPSGYQVYDEVPVFKEDRALFLAMTGSNTSLFKDMESDFGIIPLPKYDANQEAYYSYCQPWGSAAVNVPVTNSDIARTGMIIEALAAVGKYISTPAVYDITLKTKYARDNDSEAMLDIILAGSRYDFAFIYDWGGIYNSYVSAINKGENFISKWESIEGKAQLAMEKTIATFMGE